MTDDRNDVSCAIIVVKKNDSLGLKYEIKKHGRNYCILGAHEHCDIQIRSDGVAGLHALVHVDAGNVYIQGLEAKMPIHLPNVGDLFKGNEHHLQNDDSFLIGDRQFRIIVGDSRDRSADKEMGAVAPDANHEKTLRRSLRRKPSDRRTSLVVTDTDEICADVSSSDDLSPTSRPGTPSTDISAMLANNPSRSSVAPLTSENPQEIRVGGLPINLVYESEAENFEPNIETPAQVTLKGDIESSTLVTPAKGYTKGIDSITSSVTGQEDSGGVTGVYDDSPVPVPPSRDVGRGYVVDKTASTPQTAQNLMKGVKSPSNKKKLIYSRLSRGLPSTPLRRNIRSTEDTLPSDSGTAATGDHVPRSGKSTMTCSTVEKKIPKPWARAADKSKDHESFGTAKSSQNQVSEGQSGSYVRKSFHSSAKKIVNHNVPTLNDHGSARKGQSAKQDFLRPKGVLNSINKRSSFPRRKSVNFAQAIELRRGPHYSPARPRPNGSSRLSIRTAGSSKVRKFDTHPQPSPSSSTGGNGQQTDRIQGPAPNETLGLLGGFWYVPKNDDGSSKVTSNESDEQDATHSVAREESLDTLGSLDDAGCTRQQTGGFGGIMNFWKRISGGEINSSHVVEKQSSEDIENNEGSESSDDIRNNEDSEGPTSSKLEKYDSSDDSADMEEDEYSLSGSPDSTENIECDKRGRLSSGSSDRAEYLNCDQDNESIHSDQQAKCEEAMEDNNDGDSFPVYYSNDTDSDEMGHTPICSDSFGKRSLEFSTGEENFKMQNSEVSSLTDKAGENLPEERSSSEFLQNGNQYSSANAKSSAMSDSGIEYDAAQEILPEDEEQEFVIPGPQVHEHEAALSGILIEYHTEKPFVEKQSSGESHDVCRIPPKIQEVLSNQSEMYEDDSPSDNFELDEQEGSDTEHVLNKKSLLIATDSEGKESDDVDLSDEEWEKVHHLPSGNILQRSNPTDLATKSFSASHEDLRSNSPEKVVSKLGGCSDSSSYPDEMTSERDSSTDTSIDEDMTKPGNSPSSEDEGEEAQLTSSGNSKLGDSSGSSSSPDEEISERGSSIDTSIGGDITKTCNGPSFEDEEEEAQLTNNRTPNGKRVSLINTVLNVARAVSDRLSIGRSTPLTDEGSVEREEVEIDPEDFPTASESSDGEYDRDADGQVGEEEELFGSDSGERVEDSTVMVPVALESMTEEVAALKVNSQKQPCRLDLPSSGMLVVKNSSLKPEVETKDMNLHMINEDSGDSISCAADSKYSESVGDDSESEINDDEVCSSDVQVESSDTRLQESRMEKDGKPTSSSDGSELEVSVDGDFHRSESAQENKRSEVMQFSPSQDGSNCMVIVSDDDKEACTSTSVETSAASKDDREIVLIGNVAVDEFSNMKVVHLRKLLKKFGLSTAGAKAGLVNRLREHAKNGIESEQEDGNREGDAENGESMKKGENGADEYEQDVVGSGRHRDTVVSEAEVEISSGESEEEGTSHEVDRAEYRSKTVRELQSFLKGVMARTPGRLRKDELISILIENGISANGGRLGEEDAEEEAEVAEDKETPRASRRRSVRVDGGKSGRAKTPSTRTRARGGGVEDGESTVRSSRSRASKPSATSTRSSRRGKSVGGSQSSASENTASTRITRNGLTADMKRLTLESGTEKKDGRRASSNKEEEGEASKVVRITRSRSRGGGKGKFEKMTVAVLRGLLKEEGKCQAGTKGVLIARLEGRKEGEAECGKCDEDM